MPARSKALRNHSRDEQALKPSKPNPLPVEDFGIRRSIGQKLAVADVLGGPGGRFPDRASETVELMTGLLGVRNGASRSLRWMRDHATMRSMNSTAHDWSEALDRDGFVTFPMNKKQTSIGILGAIGFVAVGTLFILRGSAALEVLGWVTVLFFGLGGLLGSLTLATGGPAVRVDHLGLTWGKASAAWSEITDITIFTVQKTAMVIVRQTPEAAARNRATLSPLRRSLLRLYKGYIGPNGAFLPTANGFDAVAMASWLDALRQNRGNVPSAAASPDSAPLPRPSGSNSRISPKQVSLWFARRRRPWTAQNRKSNLIFCGVMALLVMAVFLYTYVTGSVRTSSAEGRVMPSSGCEVTFITSDGQPVDWSAPSRERLNFGRSDCADPVGSTVTIWYDPNNPLNATLENPRHRGDDLYVGGSAAVIIAGYGTIRWRLAGRQQPSRA